MNIPQAESGLRTNFAELAIRSKDVDSGPPEKKVQQEWTVVV